MRRVVPVLAVAVTAAALSAAVVATPAAARAVSSPATHGHAVAQHLGSGFWRHHRQASAPRRSATPKPLTAAQQLSRTVDATRGSSTELTLTGTSAAALGDVVRSAGGQVLGSVPGEITALVPKPKVSALRNSAAVDAVRAPERAWVQAGPTSEGVNASGAGSWQGAGTTGAGVTIGIVDAGFAGLNTAEQDHDLPANLGIAGNHCANSTGTDHGTAVAEIAHQMAPDATLELYCVDDAVGMNTAASEIVTDHANGGVSIVNCSLGFDGDSRGDGTGPTGSAAAAVAKVRKAGVLWVESAGNDATDHWSGTFADANSDGLLDIAGTDDDNDEENDGVFVSGGGSADAVLRWDQWPTSSAPVTFLAFGEQCTDQDCSGTTDINNGNPIAVKQTRNTEPVLDIPLNDTGNATPQVWFLQVELGRGFPKVHYDLNYEGDVAPSEQASDAPARAAAGSIEQPADSPYVFSVGAADVGTDGTPRGTLEDFSAQGPTIDSRVKPEITGWDGVSSPEYGTPNADDDNGAGFYGTSASSPHVAGAAALVKSANPSLDAAQIQNFLEQRASQSTTLAEPFDPPSDSVGHGLLTLGPAPAANSPVSAPQGSRYTPLPAPSRLLDSRKTNGTLGAGGTVTVTDNTLPDDVTAVAINLTGVGATGTTFLSAYPTTWPGTSNLNLTSADHTAAVFAIVSVQNKSFQIRNAANKVDVVVDEVGYFGTGSENGTYNTRTPATRVVDTRNGTGGHKGVLVAGQSVTVDPALPPTATAAVVNVTAVNPAGGFASAAPTCSADTSTVNFGKYTRANLAVVGLDAGTFCVEEGSGRADILVDVVGYLDSSGTGARYVALPSAYRIIDTRNGNGGNAGGSSPRPIGPNASATFYGANVGDVPASATSLFTGTTVASATATGFLTLFPGTTRPTSPTSNLNYSPGRIVPNAAIAAVSTGHQFGIFNSGGNTHVAVDLFGYFAP